MFLPSNWPSGFAFGVSPAPTPPYTGVGARGGGTLDAVLLTTSSGLTTMGGSGGGPLLPTTVTCPNGVVGYAWQTESSTSWPYGGGTFSGIQCVIAARGHIVGTCV